MCKFRIKISGYQGPTFAQNEKNLGTLAPSVFKIRLTGYSVVVTSNRTCTSWVDSYLVERLHSRKATDRENLFTVRIQGVPLVGKFVFLSKVFTLEPLRISYHWAVLLIQIKVMRGKPFSTREC